MFILHTSNRTENLLAHLTAVLGVTPLSSPFDQEKFLIQSQGMERWLSQQLASHFKVWANYEFLFPGKFFSSLALDIDSSLNDEAYDRERIMWHFESLLRQLEGDVFVPLNQYISGENIALKRFQLARQLAQIFDQYQIMRPDMLAAWQLGNNTTESDSEPWQQALWRKLLQLCGDQHRGVLWQQVIAKLNTAPEGSLKNRLPERLSVFGVNAMPPLFLNFLQGVARHADVHVYLLNPAQTYWADLDSKRSIARQNLQRKEVEESHGHPLLATLGQQGREFQELLLEQTDFQLEYKSFEMNESIQANVLNRLQNDILNNQTQTQFLTPDNSIAIHACHSRMREVQVLKNQLLQTLENSPELELRNIVVMAPDIQEYAPFISAVFDDVQHAIADRSLRLNNTVLDCFIRFMRLSQSRFGWQSVVDLLEQPTVYTSFGLSMTDLEWVRHWINDTHIRWGQSATHRKELGLPELTENTWQTGLDRLLMGYAIADDEFVNGTLPYNSIEGSSALALGGLHDFLQLLFRAASDMSRAKPLRDWAEQLYYYADTLFNSSIVEASDRQELNELISELADDFSAIHNDDVELDVIIAWLENTVQERKSSNGFLRGQLTFCSMLPMRSIPFQVIALLGMNEGDFPKIERHPTFDLLGQYFRKGDRSRRADDRYQFLEILLSARQQLIITYIGQSINNNEVIQPSVIISELLEILQENYQLHDMITRDPLQAFSDRYFTDNEKLFSYSKTDCKTAASLFDQVEKQPLWWTGKLPYEHQDVIDLNALFAFYRHPQRYFVQQRLSVFLQGIETESEEREPFQLDNFEAYQINHEWIIQQLVGKTLSVHKLQAQGRWLSGVCGEIEFSRQEQEIAAFVDRINARKLGTRRDDQFIDIHVGDFRLVGKLSNLYQEGGLFFRYANLKGRDLLQALLHHLLINCIQSQSTCLLSKDDADILLTPEHCKPGALETFIELYQQGHTHPNTFFVDPALAYIQQAFKLKHGSRATKPALLVAQENLANAINSGYEPEISLLYRGVDDAAEILDESFARKCQTLLEPVWEATHGH